MGTSPLQPEIPNDADSNAFSLENYDFEWLETIGRLHRYVWCDASIGTNDNIQDDNNTIRRLTNVTNKNRELIHTFNDVVECKKFIEEIDNVCLIVSGRFGLELVPQVHNLQQLHSIYIFCYDKGTHEPWASHYSKIRGVYTKIDEICNSIKSNMLSETLTLNRIEYDILKNQAEYSEGMLKLSLLSPILTRIILLNMDTTSQTLPDMVNYWFNQYKNPSQERLINNFKERYCEYNPIWWYTKNYFFEGVVNHALRTHNLYALCMMHGFIKDIDSYLHQLQNNRRISNSGMLYLYFAQFIPENNLRKLKSEIGNLLCINEFLFANTEECISRMFLKSQDASKTRNLTRTIFRICINPNVEANVFYANIGECCPLVHQNEYLISMLSIYRIEKVERYSSIAKAWIVDITLLSKTDQEYQQMKTHIGQKYLTDGVNLIKLGNMLSNHLYQFKLINKLFKKMFQQNNDNIRVISALHNVGTIQCVLGQCKESVNTYQNVVKAMKILRNDDQHDCIYFVPIFLSLAVAYQKSNQYFLAFPKAFDMIAVLSKYPGDSTVRKELESLCYYILGTIDEQERKTNEALEFYNRALQIRLDYLPSYHPDVTSLNSRIDNISVLQHTAL